MPIRHDKRNIPTIAQAIDRFIPHRKREGKDFRNDISVLRGTENRVTGKKAAGTALAKSELGGLRCDRVTDWDLSDWFEDRHEALAHNTRRRGMATLRALIQYCITNRWMDEAMLEHFAPLPKVDAGHRDWLHPEQVVALVDLIESDEFDAYQRFAFYTLLCTGVRPAELVKLRANDLDPRAQMLKIGAGKGAGDGKARKVPVDAEYIAMWKAHVSANSVRPTGWMFFRRHRQFIGGGSGEVSWVEDKGRHATPTPIRRMLSHNEARNGRAATSLWDLAQVELSAELAPAFQITPRVMRRTFACLALIDHAISPNSGWDLRTLQKALGHASLEITQIYLSDVEEYLGLTRGRFNAVDAARRAAQRSA